MIVRMVSIRAATLHEFGAAREDLLAAARLEPANRAVRQKLAECGEAARRERQEERQLYAAMLGGSGSKEADMDGWKGETRGAPEAKRVGSAERTTRLRCGLTVCGPTKALPAMPEGEHRT